MQVNWHLTYLLMLLQTLLLKVTMRFRLGSRSSLTLPVDVKNMVSGNLDPSWRLTGGW
jgi:hypothetical protein